MKRFILSDSNPWQWSVCLLGEVSTLNFIKLCEFELNENRIELSCMFYQISVCARWLCLSVIKWMNSQIRELKTVDSCRPSCSLYPSNLSYISRLILTSHNINISLKLIELIWSYSYKVFVKNKKTVWWIERSAHQSIQA